MSPGAIPPLKPTPVERAVRPFVEFAEQQASSGIVLIACGFLAFTLANTAAAATYREIWEQVVVLRLGGFELSKSLHHAINDGLMAVFFLLVGLEIKRELMVGELCTLRKASLPLIAALGGMAIPALIFSAFNVGTPSIRGFGIPTATDIAFALGVVALLGNRVPASLKVTLAALAIADDIGAVLIIALFYSSGIQLDALGVMAGIWGLMFLLNALGARSILLYTALFAFLWYFTLRSGLHATISGVLAAMAVPAKSRVDGGRFLDRLAQFTAEFRESGDLKKGSMITEAQEAAVHGIERNIERVTTPLQRLMHALHPWVGFFIMPLFALANAGVSVGRGFAEVSGSPVFLGVLLGLVVGKPVGIFLFSWVGVKLRLCELPTEVNWRQMLGMSMLAGIGFTMSLFIADLAFNAQSEGPAAKVAILLGSLTASILGTLLLLWVRSPKPGRELGNFNPE